MSTFYIRPIGRIHAPALEGSLQVGGTSFAAAEVIERDGPLVSRRFSTAADLLASPHVSLQPLLNRLRAPRAPIAGCEGTRPLIMGIVNVTPDSFSDGGQFFDAETAISHALQLEEEGADILDIGGESTRPGAEPISIDEEMRRILPVVEAVARRVRVPVSIDTRNAAVMSSAADAGARLINDVSALTHDPESLATAASLGLPVVLMHALGDPRTMQNDPRYDDVVLDVYDALAQRVEACARAGIPRERLIVDPGIGFGKTLAHNLTLLGSLSIFQGLGCPVLLGASRKSFISRLTGAAADERLPGSLAAALVAAEQGANIIRVHDVAATRQALAIRAGAFAAGATNSE
jgi:dihydropteroate synthase